MIAFNLTSQTDADINETLRGLMLMMSASGLGIRIKEADDILVSDFLVLAGSMLGKEPT